MEAWKPMQNVMGEHEIFLVKVNGDPFEFHVDATLASGDTAATIADQAIMQMLCDND